MATHLKYNAISTQSLRLSWTADKLSDKLFTLPAQGHCISSFFQRQLQDKPLSRIESDEKQPPGNHKVLLKRLHDKKCQES